MASPGIAGGKCMYPLPYGADINQLHKLKFIVHVIGSYP